MTVSQITAAKLKQIYGASLLIKVRDGSEAIIRIPQQPTGWPRGGAEAYGLRTELEINRPSGKETIPAFLKLFKIEVKERENRTRLLIDMELAKKSHFFHGIPFGWLGRFNINGVELNAHFTRMIAGPYNGGPEDFGRLRVNGRWTGVGAGHRRRFAAELAAAVAGLERANLVHGDISPGNVLIGQSSKGQDICILCDYDGYASKWVPRLPRKDGSFHIRPMGTFGYQYPSLIAALEADSHSDADLWVETDRFALGVVLCEMLVWSDDVDQLMQAEGRGQLLTSELITSRDLSRLPTRVIDAFPQGFMLLDKALHANGPTAMPSPEDWLRVLGFEEAVEYKGRPLIALFQRVGNGRTKLGAFRLMNPSGDFGKAAPQLAGIKYAFEERKLELQFATAPRVRRRREGRLADIAAGGATVSANPGDIYYMGEWELEIADQVPAAPPAPATQPN
jgi:hypothetical protein